VIEIFFENLNDFLETKISPISNELDHDFALLNDCFLQLSEIGGLKLLIPELQGGLGGERIDWITYNIQMAQYSGALLFLQAQHQFAIAQLKKLSVNNKIQDLFNSVSETKKTFGIALAAKRNLLKVTSTEQGYLISGRLPWVSGLGFFSHLLCSFNIEDRIYYTLIPFKRQNNLEMSLIETAVFNSANTVSVILDNYEITRGDIISEHIFEEKMPMEHPVVYNFAGVARALLKMADKGKYYNNKYAAKYFSCLNQEWDLYYDKIVMNNVNPFTLRAEGQRLAERCLSFTRMIIGAESLLASHPMNRMAREIWQYSVAGYSENQFEAYVSTL
jgi:hypothetical protein